MLADEARHVRRALLRGARWRGWVRLGTGPPPEPRAEHMVRALAEADVPWPGLGVLHVTDDRLVFEDDERRSRARLATVERVERWRTVLWVRRRRAPDWLVVCENAADAERLAARIARP